MAGQDGKVTIKIDVDGKQVEVGLEEVKRKIADVEGSGAGATQNSQKNLAALKLGMTAVTAAITAAGVASVRYATEFEAAFAKTRTIIDENVVSAGEMQSAVMDLSTATGMAATDVSEAVYQAVSGSVDTADAVGFVDRANKLAVAGFTSLTNATDVLTTTLNAYGMEANKVGGISNVLIRTQNLGKTSVDELSASMGKAISTGSAYGVDLENIATGYVELTRGGIATAEATTYLSGMFNELGNSGSKVGTIIRENTGQSFGELMASGHSLADVLGILYDSVNGNSEALIGLWGSQEAGKAANAILVQGLEDFNSVCAQMSDELAGVTGTTEAAYATMTNTSEFLDKQFANSVRNLAIAYSSTLTPALDKLKKIAIDGLTRLTEFVQAHPGVVSAITGITTAVAVLASGYTAYTIAANIATIATKTFTAAMDTNPILLVISAVAALVVGIGVMVASTQEGTSAVEDCTQALDELQQTREDDLASTEAAASVAEQYIATLEQLEAAGLQTNEQQALYHSTLVSLTQTIPTLADLIDLETDTIKGGTAALRESTAAWRENARQQAYQEYLSGVYQQQATAMLEAEKANIKLASAQSALTANEEKQRDVRRSSAAIWAQYRNSVGLTAEELQALEAKGHELDYTLSQLEVEHESLQIEVDGLTESYADAEEAVTVATDAVYEAEGAVDGLTAGTGELHAEMESTGDAMGELPELTGAITTALSDATGVMDTLRAAYDQAYSAALRSIQGQYDLWQTADAVTATSVASMNTSIQSQIDYWQNYNANLESLSKRNISGLDEMVASFSDGSAESAAAIAGLAGATDEEVEEMVANWLALQEEQDATAANMAEMQTGVNAELDKIVQGVEEAVGDMNLSAEASEAARETISAYVAALWAGQTDVAAAASAIASTVNTQLHKPGRTGSGGMSAYASGTTNAAAGLAIVGEEGPELVILRGGEQILSAQETAAAARAVYPSVSGTFAYGSGFEPGASGTQLRATIVVPLSIDGREMARATAEYMGEEMDFEVM